MLNNDGRQMRCLFVVWHYKPIDQLIPRTISDCHCQPPDNAEELFYYLFRVSIANIIDKIYVAKKKAESF